MAPGTTTPTRRPGTRRVFCYGAIALYSVCTFLPGLLHAVVHRHEVAATHSAVQEQDPCHRMLYHGAAAACGHDAHLSGTDECPLCDVVCHAEQAIVTQAIMADPPAAQPYFSCYKQRLESYWAVQSSSRAPPAQA